jgi:hypothetical protein
MKLLEAVSFYGTRLPDRQAQSKRLFNEKVKGDFPATSPREQNKSNNDQWRIVFKWAEGNAFEVETKDYH